MAEQNHGFRKFIMDPKSSVMSYIAENIPPERLYQQQQTGTFIPQGNSVLSQPTNATNLAQLHPGQYPEPSHETHQISNASLRPEAQHQQAGPILQVSSQPTYVQPPQSQDIDLGKPHAALGNFPPQGPGVSVGSTTGQYVPYPDAPQGYQVSASAYQLENTPNLIHGQSWQSHNASLQESQHAFSQGKGQSVGFYNLRSLANVS